MRFMMIVKADADYEAGTPPQPELSAAIEKLGEKLTKRGALLELGGLLPSSMGSRIRIKGKKLIVVDGPFAETKELIGGFAILQAQSKEEAIELGKEFMNIHGEVLGPSYEGELEIRPMAEDAAGGGCELIGSLNIA